MTENCHDKQIELSNCYRELFFSFYEIAGSDDPKEFQTALGNCLHAVRRVAQMKGFSKTLSENQLHLLYEKEGIDADGQTTCHKSSSYTDAVPFLITEKSDRSLYEVIKEELENSLRANLISAFVTRGMINLLLDPFNEFIKNGGQLRLLTSVMNDFNDPKDLIHIQENIPNMGLRIFYPKFDGVTIDYSSPPPPFHIKCYLFEKSGGRNSLVIGSSNLTESGFNKNFEWNYFSNMETNLPLATNQSAFETGIAIFEKYWNEDSTVLNQGFLRNYEARRNDAQRLRRQLMSLSPDTSKTLPVPRPSQIEALANLQRRRSIGVTKTAIIAATGLGKTFLAAYDFQQSNLRNVLFLAHRETILSKAVETYRKVLGDSSFGRTLTGDSTASDLSAMTRQMSSVFAMVPSMVAKSKFKSFAQDHFDYVVIDEFHHSAAISYQQLLDWFKPKFLLGLTATPERMDGRDVLAECDYDVAYEIRLFKAIDKEWLVPFQYFAIYDPTDYRAIRWVGNGYDEIDLDKALINDTRAELIVRNLKKFLPSTGKIKALAFCSSRAHCNYMNRRFNEAGLYSECLLGEDSDDIRKTCINDLQDENHPLQVICSVDIFGEGVDVPAVSHVLFLRPTMSFTVFLQQLGRGLRVVLGKEFVVCLDFVGDFRNSYVAHLVLRGFNGLQQYRDRNKQQREPKPPQGCYIKADTEVQKVWANELRRVLAPTNRKEALRELYEEMRLGLERSPNILDFFANPTAHDPFVFIKEFNGWLRAKKFFGDLNSYEESLLDTPGELFLTYIEKDLHPTRSYKMVVLMSLLSTSLSKHQWSIEEIALGFKQYYLDNPAYLEDYSELATHSPPELFPIARVTSKLLEMPLKYMTNKENDFFILYKKPEKFELKEPIRQYWHQPKYRDLLNDRVLFAIKRYFYRVDSRAARRTGGL
jgi:superfamily II DNA or RNA helicase/HKD family nuclease